MPDVLPLQPGDPGRLGDHLLEGRLGEGRRGIVFLGGHEGVPVAVKLLHTRLSGDPGARAEFLRELQAGQRVGGTRTARPLVAEVAGDWPFVVSELVSGPSLQRMMNETGRGDRSTVERLAIGIALALAELHRAGLTHGELKPSNVLISPDGPKLIDVGIARALAAAGMPVDPGVPAYQPPELLTGTGSGPAADVWSWGAIIAAAASGTPPFGDDTAEAVSQRIISGEPDLSRLPDSLRDLVIMALGKDPFRRPTAGTVLQTLLRRGIELPPDQLAEAQALLDGPVPDDPWSSLPPAPPLNDPRNATGSFAPRLDPFSGPYLPPAGTEQPEPANPTAQWEAPPEPEALRTLPAPAPEPEALKTMQDRLPGKLQDKLQDKKVIKGLAGLVVGVLGGILVIMMLLGGEDEAPAAKPTASAPPPPSGFSGSWSGTATNQAGASFSLDLAFSDGQSATVKLGVGKCVGALTRTGGDERALDMAFTRTSGKCTPGNVKITNSDNGELHYVWSKGERRYEATLNRK